MVTLTVVAVAVCWGAFALTWLSGAIYNSSRGPARSTRSRFGSVMVVGFVVVWLIAHAVPTSDWNDLSVHTIGVRLVGLAILVGSTAFTLWARFTLGTMWSSDPTVKQGHELRTDGPYGVTRHPIYTGMLGMLLGTTLVSGVGPLLMVVPVVLVLFEIKLHIEERLMLTAFPGEYPQYRERVPQLVPGLRRLHRTRGAVPE